MQTTPANIQSEIDANNPFRPEAINKVTGYFTNMGIQPNATEEYWIERYVNGISGLFTTPMDVRLCLVPLYRHDIRTPNSLHQDRLVATYWAISKWTKLQICVDDSDEVDFICRMVDIMSDQVCECAFGSMKIFLRTCPGMTSYPSHDAHAWADIFLEHEIPSRCDNEHSILLMQIFGDRLLDIETYFFDAFNPIEWRFEDPTIEKQIMSIIMPQARSDTKPTDESVLKILKDFQISRLFQLGLLLMEDYRTDHHAVGRHFLKLALQAA